jgi:hypothetical protein
MAHARLDKNTIKRTEIPLIALILIHHPHTRAHHIHSGPLSDCDIISYTKISNLKPVSIEQK